MAYSQYPNVTDELLSAYIDGVVTAAERALVEEAAASDQRIAWRLDTLRHTVALLGQLSDVPLPRSFMVSEAMLAESTTASPVAVQAVPEYHSTGTSETPSFWERWQRFWGSGNVMWRNAAAVCAVLLLLVLVGASLTTQQHSASLVSLSDAELTAADLVSFEASSAKATEQNGVADEAAEVAMAPATIVPEAAENDDLAPMSGAEGVALDMIVETETDDTAMEQTETAVLSLSDPADVAVTANDYVEGIQVKPLASTQAGTIASQAGADAFSSSVNSAALSAVPHEEDADTLSSASPDAVIVSMTQTMTVVASMSAPAPMMEAAPAAPESPLNLEMAAAPSRAGSSALSTGNAARQLSTESSIGDLQAAPERRAPAVATEQIAPTDTPSAIALAETQASSDSDAGSRSAAPGVASVDTISKSSGARQRLPASSEAMASSPWDAAVIAVQVLLLLLLLLLILFVALWLRSRSRQSATG